MKPTFVQLAASDTLGSLETIAAICAKVSYPRISDCESVVDVEVNFA